MALSVDNLTVTLPRRPVIRDLSFEAAAGEITCLIGPNGAGKSTLLRAVAQLLPSRGDVRFEAYSLSALDPDTRSRKLAYLPQFTETPALSALEVLELGRRPHAGARIGPEDRRVLDELIEHFGLAHYLPRSIATLSGGERQKVMIAAALAQEPSLLLLDEPISHLDPANQAEVLRSLAHFTRERDMVTLLVLHDVQHALFFGDSLLLLKEDSPCRHLRADAVDSGHLSALYDIPAQLFRQEGRPFVFFGNTPGKTK